MARERPTASTDHEPDVRPSIAVRRVDPDGLTRAEARALTRCASLNAPRDRGAGGVAATGWTTRADQHCVGGLRRRVVSFAALAGLPSSSLAELEVAVSEALTNVVLHAYRQADELGDVRVDVEVEPGDVVVRVRDYGLGIGPRPDSPGLGLGLALIDRLSSRNSVRPCLDGGTEVSMWFSLRPPAAVSPA